HSSSSIIFVSGSFLRFTFYFLVGHVNIFQFGVPLHGGHAEVAADAALFETAKRGLDVHAAVRVDAEHAGLNPPGNSKSAAEVVRPERAAQAVGRGVDITNHLFLVLEGTNANDRTEDLHTPATGGHLHF